MRKPFLALALAISLGACAADGPTPQPLREINRYGTEGALMELNAEAQLSLPAGADCQDHVAAVRRMLAGRHPDLKAEPLYSCPNGGFSIGLCHVSVLVTDAQGERLVVDNGAVLRRYPVQVARLEEFSREVEHTYWIGQPPVSIEKMEIQAFFEQLNF